MDIHSFLKVLLYVRPLGNIQTHCRMGLKVLYSFLFFKQRFRKREISQSFFCFLIQKKPPKLQH